MLNTRDFAKLYAEEYGVTWESAKNTCDSFWKLLSKLLYQEGQDVFIRRFGVFKHKRTPQTRVRHPVTGEIIAKPSRDVVKFKQSEVPYTSVDLEAEEE